MTSSSFSLVDPLLALGLTLYEARVYIALATRSGLSAAQVATAARIPRQRVYDVLESLEVKKLVLRHDLRPARFDVIDPQRGINHLVDAGRQLAVHVVSQLRPAWLAARAGQPAPGRSAAPRGRVALAESGQWREAAQHSVLATACPPFEGIEDPSWIKRVDQLTATGGTVRCIYHSDILDDPALLASARDFAEAGEVSRVTHDVPTRMILTDGRRALLPMLHSMDSTAATPMLLIDDPQVITGLEKSFESLWDQATPLYEAAATEARPRG
jgi:hypothetical protein